MPKTQYTQKFREAWLKDPTFKEWLLAIDSTSGKEAKCKFCGKIIPSRYADFKSHSESKKHKQNASVFLGRSFQGKVQPKISFPANQEDTRSAESRLALFIAQHASINITDHLTDTCKKAFINCSVSTHLQMHRTKCSNIIKNVLSPHFVKQLCDDIGDSPFSILLDESTDITIDKYLGCTIIYFSYKMKKIVNSFLDLVRLEACDANAIVDALLDTLRRFHLNIANLKGIGSDNASVMVGINNGVYAKLKERVPNLILIRCVCHSLQLAVSAAAKDCLPRNLEFLIRETYNWFQHSSSRQIMYKQIYNTINDGNDPLKITGISATRWLSIESAVSRIFNQWLELGTHFSIVKDRDKCYTAQMLYEMYKDDTNYTLICFLKPILGEVQRVNKAFEAKAAESCKLLEDMTMLLDSLIKKVTTPTSQFRLFHDDIESFVVRENHLGYLFENKINEMRQVGFANEKNLRDRCVNFLIKLIKEIIQRMPDNVAILKQISVFSVEDTLRVIKPDLIKILEHFNYEPQLIEKVNTQWKNITLKNWENTQSSAEFWCEVHSAQDSNGEYSFRELATVALSFLVLPNSNAEVQRLYSQMNLIKSKLRNRMKLSMLIAILNIRYGLQRVSKCCCDYEIPPTIASKIKNMQTYKTSDMNSCIEDNDILDDATVNILNYI